MTTTHMIALDPGELANAQRGLIGFCMEKIGQVRGELAEAQRVFDELAKANMSVIAAQRMIRIAKRRIAFYEKVQAALKMGHYILPPIPCQAFAFRTKQALPSRAFTEGYSGRNELDPKNLPVGEGVYRSSVAHREAVDTRTEIKPDGSTKKITAWANTDWREIEFPFLPVKPEIIRATAQAMAAKVFDVIAVAPPNRTADPMVIGQIRHWKGRENLHFFIAWWLDTTGL